MTAHLRGAWSQRIATSWRGLSNGKAFWNDYDAVIIPNRGPRPQFEVYTYGDQMATRPSLAQAKQAVEEIYGPVGWKLVQLPKEKAVHYYFGPTTEFTDPTSIYVVEHLPRLGTLVTAAFAAAAEGDVYYHGTVARPDIGGGKITPINQRGWGKPTFPADTDPDYAYATKDRDTAWSYAEKAWHSTSHGHPRVFRVRPLGPVESDPQRTANGDLRGNYAGDVRSKHGFEILGEEPMPEHMGKPEDWQ